MFFRREKPKQYTFDDRLQHLRDAGFTVSGEGPGRVRLAKSGCAAILEDAGADSPKIRKAGIEAAGEIAYMEHGGYQMFFRTDGGRQIPALAEHLRSLHSFQEDLKEALGLTSLYNTSLGTIADRHMYDRVVSRDKGEPRRPWESS